MTHVPGSDLKLSIQVSVAWKFPRGRGCEHGKQGNDFTDYNAGMLLSFGSMGSLAGFEENTANNSCAWNFCLCAQAAEWVAVWTHEEIQSRAEQQSHLKDIHPLAAYETADGHMVTLQDSICTAK